MHVTQNFLNAVSMIYSDTIALKFLHIWFKNQTNLLQTSSKHPSTVTHWHREEFIGRALCHTDQHNSAPQSALHKSLPCASFLQHLLCSLSFSLALPSSLELSTQKYDLIVYFELLCVQGYAIAKRKEIKMFFCCLFRFRGLVSVAMVRVFYGLCGF